MKQSEIKRSLRLANQLGFQLRGEGPGVQGAVLAELVSRWLAGHRTDLHEPVLNQWINLVRGLAVINAEIMFGEHGHPGDRRGGGGAPPPAAGPH
jgi:hypothetical protein